MTASIFAPPKGVERRQRIYRSAASTFIIVAFFVSVLAVYSAVHPTRPSSLNRRTTSQSIARRDLGLTTFEDLDCHLVHRAADKCAFVRANCLDEEAGLFSYLQLYYCNSHAFRPFALAILIIWLCLLFSTIGIAASDFFCINLSTISQLLGLSESLAGVTFLAFGNGSPDVFSTFSAMSTNSGSLAVGELIGAASFITAVVAGAMAFVRPFKVARKSFVRDVSFFIIAATFSMVFLYDGKLYLWEAAAMVGLYVFYVIFVVSWHWWLQRKKKRRQAEAAARTQWHQSSSEIAEFPEYHDEEEPEQEGQPTPRRGMSTEDISILERGRGGTGDDDDDEDDEDHEDRRKRELGEIASEMRLRRPRLRERRGTHNPVRPSLIGALEFRSVLSGLQKSGSIIPLNHRRHSDDGRFANAQHGDARSMISEPASRSAYNADTDGHSMHRASENFRSRAISAPDPAVMREATENIPTIDLLGPLVEDDASSGNSVSRHVRNAHLGIPPPSPTISSRSASPAPSHTRSVSSVHLAVPEPFPHAPQQKTPESVVPHAESPQPPSKPQKPSLRIPTSEETSFFPPHRDGLSPAGRTPSIILPSPSVSRQNTNPLDELYRKQPTKPYKWWPYSILPTPLELWSTLFPTLCGWKQKNWWERILGVVAAPSVFVLTITLPVVETENDDDESVDDDIPDLTLPSTYVGTPDDTNRSRANTVSIIIEDEETESHHIAEPFSKGLAGHGTAATVAASQESLHQHWNHPNYDNRAPRPHPHRSHSQLPTILSPSEPRNFIMVSPEQLPATAKLPSSRNWNRWLVILQTFTAPFFIVLIIWAKMYDGEPRALIRPVLISTACSLATLAIILVTTSPTRAPKWRVGLCFLGFVVSISWISTIADEVVGVLKSIGVILNISDAILGLTIFAVGNSLGDLVADYTVAKLGYPVMALSACFGGPMLNILLGVGLSGLYLTIKHAKDHVHGHPHRKMKFKPYEIEVSRTLMISGATLLVTLLGLLIVVPLRRWKMDRVVGWCLIGLWSVSTVCNVLVEILGFGQDTAVAW